MKKKTVLIISMALASALVFAGCNNTPSTSEVPSEPVITSEPAASSEPESAVPSIESVSEEEIPLLGGWTAYDGNTAELSDEEKEIYDEATADIDNLNFEPIRVVATQLVSGLNRAYLVYGNYSDSNSLPVYAIAVVYSDLNNVNTLTTLAFIDPMDLHLTEATGEKLMGGWEGFTSGKAMMLPAEDVQSSFDNVTKDAGVTLNPLALLNTQVVAGMNYLVLSADKDGNLYLTKWNSFNGEDKMLENGPMDMEYYTTK